jgi:cystathionine beta-lyase/cystathionine gamma-synthase
MSGLFNQQFFSDTRCRGCLNTKEMSNATQLIHSIPVDELTGAISVPIYQTSTFVQESPGVDKGFDYAA